MKKTITLLLMLLGSSLLPSTLSAQMFVLAEDHVLLPFDVSKWETLDSTLLTVRYNRMINYPDKELVREEMFDLQIGSHWTKFSSYNIENMDEGWANPQLRKVPVRVFYSGESIFTDLKSGEVTVVNREFLSENTENNAFLYREPVIRHQWQLTNEKDTILGHQCQKAITTFGGRTWKAWFASEIPIQAAPWKLQGLPGLILKFGDSEGIYTFTAIQISDEVQPIKKYAWRYKEISKKKFLDYMNLIYRKPSTLMSGGQPLKQMTENGVVTADFPLSYHPYEINY